MKTSMFCRKHSRGIGRGLRFSLASVLTLFTLAMLAPSEAAILRVNALQVNNPADGTSWNSAFPTVQRAVNAASAGDAIWVATATYFESVKVTNAVSLYGGFAGNETALGQRNPTLHPTTLDGGESNRVVTFTSIPAAPARLDGFIIQNGRAPEETSFVGGGVYAANASVLIYNNLIRSNATPFTSRLGYKQGGGIWVFQGSCVISNNVISHNHAVSGAGIYCYTDGLICNNRFENNVAEYIPPVSGGTVFGGGGVFVNASQPEIINNFFLANVATNLPPDEGASGGAICVVATAAPKIIGNTMLYNQALTFHYVLNNFGGGIFSSSTKGIIANNIIGFGSSGVLLYSGTGYGDRFSHNCVFGNWYDYIYTDLTGTNGNISADPLFAFSGDWDFHLSPGSPCIDAGDNALALPGSVDMDGQARIAGPAVDIGADEYGSALPFTPALRVQGTTAVLSMASEPNRTYVCEATTNLTDWFGVSTNLATNSTFEVLLPVGGPGLKLYRVKTSH